jgi:hypothetical protein
MLKISLKSPHRKQHKQWETGKISLRYRPIQGPAPKKDYGLGRFKHKRALSAK